MLESKCRVVSRLFEKPSLSQCRVAEASLRYACRQHDASD
jgi:hypothetical protein